MSGYKATSFGEDLLRKGKFPLLLAIDQTKGIFLVALKSFPGCKLFFTSLFMLTASFV